MNEFMIWFWRPIAETLGIFAFIATIVFLLWGSWQVYCFYQWLKEKLSFLTKKGK